jgi:adenosylmethionine-8-amino-7-oxononanoate aminotransferase
MDSAALLEKDHAHIWHPCSQMKDYEIFKPFIISSAQQSHFHLQDGRKIIDAISSWWCKSLGHQHPRLKEALLKQINKFEHVILANTTNEVIVELSEKLAALMPPLDKVMYASDGSCAVEIAMKMSLHARQIQGNQERKLFIALENGYHGETMGALSVSDLKVYKAPYQSVLFETKFITGLPYVSGEQNVLGENVLAENVSGGNVSGEQDKIWNNCEEHWQNIIEQLKPHAQTATAIILEPIVQGAGGMLIYSQDFLKRLRAWTREHGIHLIADEIMTGIGRTGKMLACEHANIQPDFICLAKGLTAGWLPLSAVLTTSAIYNLFYDDYQSGKSFLHSHTHSGNVLAVSLAIETLNIIKEEGLCERALELGKVMHDYMQNIAASTGKLKNVRSLGAIVAADLITDEQPDRRYGYEVYRKASELGALLRPLGNTLYWLPPLNIEWETLARLSEITEQAVQGA